jgi:NAD+ kinase
MTQRIGVVGGGDAAERVRAAGAAAVEGVDAVTREGVDAVVAVGGDALVAVARRGVEVPVLPVGAGPGVRSVAPADLDAAVRWLLGGETETHERPLLGATCGGNTVAVLFDAALAPEPTQMSEYSVAAPDEDGEPQTVDRVRADAVVVASPAGSRRYADAVGGAALSPSVDAAVVVPVAPFRVEREQWVLPYPVEVSVEREEGDVSLVADGRESFPVGCGETVRVEPTGTLRVAAAPGGAPFGRIEKT